MLHFMSKAVWNKKGQMKWNWAGGYNVFVFLSKVFSFVRNVNVKSPSGKQTLLLLSVTKICRRVSATDILRC